MVVRFFVLAFGITAATIVPASLAMRGILPLPQPLVLLLAAIGSCGPSLAAWLLVVVDGEGVGVLRAPAPRHRAVFVVVALAMTAVLHTVGASAALLFGAPTGVFTFGVPQTAEHVAILVVAPIGEELGWRAYAQRRLAAKWGELRAALGVGVAWALWHAPMVLGRPQPAVELAAGFLLVVSGSVLFAVLFHRSGGSALVAIAAHAGVHLDNVNRVGGPALLATTAAFVAAACVAVRWLRPRSTPNA